MAPKSKLIVPSGEFHVGLMPPYQSTSALAGGSASSKSTIEAQTPA